MLQRLRLLIAEDNPADAELLLRELRRAEFAPDWVRVDDEPGFAAALTGDFDLVLSDYQMPQFTGLRALELLQASGREIPFILVSGTVGEDVAVDAMRRGAADYLLKDRLSRLGPAVKRVLAEARLRRERQEAIVAQRESERLAFAALNALTAHVALVRPDGCIEAVNEAWRACATDECVCLSHGVVEGSNFLEVCDTAAGEDAPVARTIAAGVREVLAGRRTGFELEYQVHVPGRPRWFVVRVSTFGGEGPQRAVVAQEDITALRAAERDRELLAEITRSMNEACFALDAQWRFTFVNDRGVTLLKHRREQMLGRSIWEAFWKLVGTPMEACYRRAMRERVPVAFEAWSPIAERWLDIRLFPLGDGLAAFLLDIDERKRAEAALQRSEELYRTLITASPDAVVLIGSDAVIRHASDQASRLFGYSSAGEVEGRNALEFVVAADRERAAANIRRLCADGRIGVNHYTLLRQDGSAFPVDINAALIAGNAGGPDGIVLVVRDVTERVAADRELRESRDRFQQVVETIHEVFWLHDLATNEVVYVSPRFEDVWGAVRHDPRGLTRVWEESLHPADRERVLEVAAAGRRGQNYEISYRIVRPDGTIRWVQDHAYPVRGPDGRCRTIVGVAEDITERKALEEQFLRAQRMEAIGTLAGGVAHDLNNILAPVLMGASLLADQLRDPSGLELVRLIQSAAERGSGVVKQLLTFSRGIAGERVVVQLRHLVREMVAIMRETFPRDLVIEEDVPRDLWPLVGDATQLHQVLLNLCVNARDAMPRGGLLRLSVANEELATRDVPAHAPGRPGRYVTLRVSDTGCGIAPEVVDRIFDPFFTTKEVGKGTGLGLSTVLGIVRSHEGFITVSSEPGVGTTFVVRLPAAEAHAVTPRAALEPELPRGDGELILLVDDEPSVRRAVQRALESHGYRTLAAANGEEALQVYLPNRDSIRLVLTDLMMPVMDGQRLIRALRTVSPALPVVATSGVMDHEQREELRAAGVHELLPKPAGPRELLEAIRRGLASGCEAGSGVTAGR